MAINLYSKASTDSLLAAKLSDAPIDGSTYGRNNGAWAVVSGGGGLTISTLSNAATATLNAGVPTAGQALTYDGTDLIWATVSGSYLPLAGGTVTGPIIVDESATSGFTTTFNGDGLQMGGGQYISQEESVVSGFNINLQASGTVNNIGTLSFADSTTQSSAGVSSDKAIANAFAASMWYAWDGYDRARNGVVNTNYIGGSYLSAGISDGTTFAAGFPATNATLDTGSYWYVSINGTLSDLFIYSP